MKPTLTLITILIAVAVSGQYTRINPIGRISGADTLVVDTAILIKPMGARKIEEKKSKDTTFNPSYFSGGTVSPFIKGDWSFTKNNTFLYCIKADGTIELGDLIIDAVVKGLEKKGYVVKKKKHL